MSRFKPSLDHERWIAHFPELSSRPLLIQHMISGYPVSYSGLTFNGCYHCLNRNPKHVKSGACWTAWKAKKREWIII